MENKDPQSLLEQLSAAAAPPPMESLTGSIPHMPADFIPSDFSEDIPEEIINPVDDPIESNETGKIIASTSLPPKELARAIIETADGLLTQLLPNIYLNTFSHKEKAAILSIAGKVSLSIETKQPLTLSAEDQEQMGLVNSYKEYCEAVPLSKDEKSTLLGPLTKVLEKSIV